MDAGMKGAITDVGAKIDALDGSTKEGEPPKEENEAAEGHGPKDFEAAYDAVAAEKSEYADALKMAEDALGGRPGVLAMLKSFVNSLKGGDPHEATRGLSVEINAMGLPKDSKMGATDILGPMGNVMSKMGKGKDAYPKM